MGDFLYIIKLKLGTPCPPSQVLFNVYLNSANDITRIDLYLRGTHKLCVVILGFSLE